ncbi:uncharacterized protein C16orf92 homolog [Octodon degus]|uniref:Uncharacterized protein C16orf92 homolog n=1 Tax=Octodon degus TaxID=10160 RepID=A0A6P6DZQ6_OCTDE|nr:uncharacterized protein C16orf92 homolog [Octodon degus]
MVEHNLQGLESASAYWGGAGGVSLAAAPDFAWVLVSRPVCSEVLAPGASPCFVERPNFFDYPDSDQASRLAVAQFIGERPVEFVRSGSGPGLFHHILLGLLVVAFLYVLFQFCTHLRGSPCSPCTRSPPPPSEASKNWMKMALVAFTRIVFISSL